MLQFHGQVQMGSRIGMDTIRGSRSDTLGVMPWTWENDAEAVMDRDQSNQHGLGHHPYSGTSSSPWCSCPSTCPRRSCLRDGPKPCCGKAAQTDGAGTRPMDEGPWAVFVTARSFSTIRLNARPSARQPVEFPAARPADPDGGATTCPGWFARNGLPINEGA